MRLTWRLFVLLTLAAACAVGWAFKYRASRSQSVYLRGLGRYCVAVSTPKGILAFRVNGDPAARPGEPRYGYTSWGASDEPARQIQAGPAVFDLVSAGEIVRGPVIISAGVAASTVPPPAVAEWVPGDAGAAVADATADMTTAALMLLRRRAAPAAGPVYTYAAVSVPHGLAVAALALPAGLHVMLFWRALWRRAPRIKVKCSCGERREKARHCHACGAKVD